jgi:CheY-like chemotaxis protein
MLRSSDCRVLEATTGKEALDLQNGPIDLLISDVGVPVLSGTEVALELNKSHPATAILFVSGTPMSAWNRRDRQNFQRLPPDRVDFLEKPFRAAALLDKVGELIEGRAHNGLTITAPPTFGQEESNKKIRGGDEESWFRNKPFNRS